MSHRCPICSSTFTRSFNLRRHIERVHKRVEEDLEGQDGNSVASEGSGKQSGDYAHSSEGSYDDRSESDSNESASQPMEEDSVTDRDDTDSCNSSDTEGADRAEEFEEDDTVTDSGGEEEEGRGNVSGTMVTLAALTEMNKAMEKILKRALQNM
ncbi:hypothetical protein HOLleu_25313 [Holothuria leucospilota]|uniref:C2H2-type domain-containing protein n=1 Tax=Holothuria leucospilota TaxID=206669 RepID=A0A9Q1BSF2_HOLLE|nr:hypothetical protein HOLleu_25313 [Holothuria leucospilota]